MKIASTLMNLLPGINQSIDRLIPDVNQRDQVRAAIAQELISNQNDFESSFVEMVKAEATSESWLTRNWRPLCGMSLVALLWAHSMGLTVNVTPAVAERLLTIVGTFLGVYGAGRTVEKVVENLPSGVFRRG